MIYIMPTEEKDAQIGKLVREKKEAEQDLAHLIEKAKTIGKNLVELGSSLRDYPGRLTFPHVSTDARFHADKVVSFPVLSLEELKALVAAIQEKQLVLWDSTLALKNLGIG